MKHLAWLVIAAGCASAQSAFAPPYLPDGHPDFGGIWMAATLSAAFNVEEHAASYGTPAGPSVIVDPPGGKLPYLPGMRERAIDNDQHRERDPVGQCHMHGVPRVMFPPFPLEVVQDGDYVVILTETEHGVRIIPTDGRPHDPKKIETTYMGYGVGKWEGDTLIVDSISFVDSTWLGRGGFIHSDNMHVIEKFRREGNVLLYDVTVEDPDYLIEPYVFPTRVVQRSQNPDAGLIRERGDCEVYDLGNATSQIRH